ncbi:MAG: hypothetical protein ABEN55_10495, partial [Bradymonadaceae bacterium]
YVLARRGLPAGGGPSNAANSGQPGGGQSTNAQPQSAPESTGQTGTPGGGSPQVQSTLSSGPGQAGAGGPGPQAGPGTQTGGSTAKPQTGGGSPRAEPAARQSSSWAVDDVERVDEQFGASGFQKFGNFLLIVLIVGAGFLTFVAAQNAWFVDFAKFRQMLQVAFQNGDYEPREEWTESSQPVQPAPPENPIEFRNVFAQVLTLGGEESDDEEAPRVLVLRGDVKNVSGQSFPGAKVRGLIKDAEGRVLQQKVAPVGADVAPGDLRSVESTDKLGDKLPDSPTELGKDGTQPFTIVFRSVPDDVTSGKAVHYSVEFESEKDVESSTTDE